MSREAATDSSPGQANAVSAARGSPPTKDFKPALAGDRKEQQYIQISSLPQLLSRRLTIEIAESQARPRLFLIERPFAVSRCFDIMPATQSELTEQAKKLASLTGSSWS